MAYIDENLIAGERVLFRGRLHWKLFVGPALALAAGIGVLFVALDHDIPFWPSAMILIIPIAMCWSAYFRWRWSEFGVTDKRVLIKTGIVSRHTLETLLTKVENIGVEQSLWGRLFNYGTLYVTGTGATKEIFHGIHAPLEFRKAIEAAAVAFEERRSSGRAPMGVT
ncbi:MAG TPA: PH domain-containing protein [Nitrospira sp.]|nr:PH domain-containing protein [Nitrospira sp.]